MIAENHLPSTAVTFGSGNGYLKNEPWRLGDIRLSFRTYLDMTILLLQQTGSQENNIDFFVAVTTSMLSY